MKKQIDKTAKLIRWQQKILRVKSDTFCDVISDFSFFPEFETLWRPVSGQI